MNTTILVAIFFAAIAAVPSLGRAKCSCETALVDKGNGVVGSLTMVRGGVLSTSRTGLTAASAGTSLYAGSQVITGPDSAASLKVGSRCSIAMTANSEAVVVNFDKTLCVRISVAGPSAPASVADPETFRALLLTGFVAGRIISLGGGDDNASD